MKMSIMNTKTIMFVMTILCILCLAIHAAPTGEINISPDAKFIYDQICQGENLKLCPPLWKLEPIVTNHCLVNNSMFFNQWNKKVCCKLLPATESEHWSNKIVRFMCPLTPWILLVLIAVTFLISLCVCFLKCMKYVVAICILGFLGLFGLYISLIA